MHRRGRWRFAPCTNHRAFPARNESRDPNARNTNTTSFTLVSHSFELINRRKQAVNRVVQRRFDGLCSWLEAAHNIATANYRGTPPLHVGETNLPRRAGQQPLAPSVLRTWPRLAEQAVSNIFY